jgi:hypothetical protein
MKKLIWVFVVVMRAGACFGQVNLWGGDSLPISNQWPPINNYTMYNFRCDTCESFINVVPIDIKCKSVCDSAPKITAVNTRMKNVNGGWTFGPMVFLSYIAVEFTGNELIYDRNGKLGRFKILKFPEGVSNKFYLLEKGTNYSMDTWITYQNTIIGHCPEKQTSAIVICEDINSERINKMYKVDVISEGSYGNLGITWECRKYQGGEIGEDKIYIVLLESIVEYDAAKEIFTGGLTAETRLAVQHCCDVTGKPLPDRNILSPIDIGNVIGNDVGGNMDDQGTLVGAPFTYGFIDFAYPQISNPAISIVADIPGRAGIYTYDDPSDTNTYHELVSGTFETGKPLQLPLDDAWACKPLKLVMAHEKVNAGNVKVSVSSANPTPIFAPDPVPNPVEK